MSAALLAFLAAVLAGLGARDQMLVAQLAARRSLPLVVVGLAILTSAATAGLAARAGEVLIPELTAGARLLFAGFAAVVAGVECLVLRPPRALKEPTRSLAAHAIVLIAHQMTDAARFLIFAIAVATAGPSGAALGGAGGGAASVTIGAMAGGALLGGKLAWPRRAIGGMFLLIGTWLIASSLL
jgi:Ca2+/H+ antiporter, TMEM165/GDT1 family